MTYQHFAAVEHAARSAMVWAPESDDPGVRYRMLMLALLPGAAILLAATAVLVRLL
ncbi:MAG: hypothetical protein P4M09_19635 [Devosia sp.]|nr:hypothetical protein [Devosia sp.]